MCVDRNTLLPTKKQTQQAAHSPHRAVLEADAVADLLAEPAPKLLGDALGDAHRRDAARLRAAELAAGRVAGLGQVLRHLRRLAAARLADHDEHLFVVVWFGCV